MVVYTSHLNACVWLIIGKMQPCLKDEVADANEKLAGSDTYKSYA